MAFRSLFGKSKSKHDNRTLLLGLDDSGKTSLLYRLKLGELVNTVPTGGFNFEEVCARGNSKVNIWDVGGQDHIRPFWRHYVDGTSIFIYVVDASQPDQFEESAKEMKNILEAFSDADRERLKVIIVANKMDLVPGNDADKIVDVMMPRIFATDQLPPHFLGIARCSAVKGDVDELYSLLGGALAASKKKSKWTSSSKWTPSCAAAASSK